MLMTYNGACRLRLGLFHFAHHLPLLGIYVVLGPLGPNGQLLLAHLGRARAYGT